MSEFARDPFRIWKILAMVMAAAVVVLCVLSLLFVTGMGVIFAALIVGTLMCSISGILALVKGHGVVGHLCSVLAGVFLVFLLVWVLRTIW